MGLFGRKKKINDDSNIKRFTEKDREWTSSEFVEHLIKYPDLPDGDFVVMYVNLLGEDNLEKDMENYWKERLAESFISQEEFEKIKNTFNQRFKKIRILSQAKK